MNASRSCPALDHWPGNVRELEHTIERAVSLTSGSIFPVMASRSKRRSGQPAISRGNALISYSRNWMISSLNDLAC